MRLIFMGTPGFACPPLSRLLGSGHQVVGVVTPPDRPKGRGQAVKPCAVKELAVQAGVPVFQPVSIGDPEVAALMAGMHPDVVVVVAFGRILPTGILQIPVLGCVNVHASLLPRYRGAAPIHRAVINGDNITGVTTMLMNAGLDTGDILMQRARPIGEDETVGEVYDSLAVIGADLLLETLAGMERGTVNRTPQADREATYAAPLTRGEEWIAWTNKAVDIKNLVRGMDPWPGAYTEHAGRAVKIWRVSVAAGDDPPGEALIYPGQVTAVDKKEGFVVQAGVGKVLVREVQPQGKSRMSAAEFARGYRVVPGQTLGTLGAGQ